MAVNSTRPPSGRRRAVVRTPPTGSGPAGPAAPCCAAHTA